MSSLVIPLFFSLYAGNKSGSHQSPHETQSCSRAKTVSGVQSFYLGRRADHSPRRDKTAFRIRTYNMVSLFQWRQWSLPITAILQIVLTFFFLSAGDWTQHLAHTRHGSELASAFPDAVFMVFWMVLLLDYPQIGDCKSKQLQNPCPVQNFNY